MPPGSGLSMETQALMERLGMSMPQAEEQDELETEDEVKVFFCSRTHSQLSQFANELRRVQIPPVFPPVSKEGIEACKQSEHEVTEEPKHLTLGSRKNLCINPKVNKLGNATAINEKCLELQQPGTTAESKCPYLPTKDNEVLMNDFRDHALAKIRDIEDFGVLGKKIGICSYYASRSAIKPTEVSLNDTRSPCPSFVDSSDRYSALSAIVAKVR